MEISESKLIRANNIASCKGFSTFAFPLYIMGGAVTSKPYSRVTPFVLAALVFWQLCAHVHWEQAPLVPLPCCCQILEAPESAHNSPMVLAPSLYWMQEPHLSPP
uniref:Uncharacterized protein n=1 Tax=Micrurus lemniscatus lemniscatus TaxID=129467 RepID=A0A2D4I4I1_MICLE